MEKLRQIYVKPTDSHQYLHSSPCHPDHFKKGIPYSQALRLDRIRVQTLILLMEDVMILKNAY